MSVLKRRRRRRRRRRREEGLKQDRLNERWREGRVEEGGKGNVAV